MNQPLRAAKIATLTVKTVLTKPASGSVRPYSARILPSSAGKTCRSMALNMYETPSSRTRPIACRMLDDLASESTIGGDTASFVIIVSFLQDCYVFDFLL